ncbi:MAG TPA: AraC family transcriptional regulator [Methylomirabilota bacterium]|nr:AraC family transcriptional regulator [Methylomirabilota bacterium]
MVNLRSPSPGPAAAPIPGWAMVEELFDHQPETAFFLKDAEGRYLAVNRSLVERCGVRDKQDLIGRHVREIFPAELARRYAAQDESVLRTGRPIVDRLELHWYPDRRAGWCLTTKLPVRDAAGRIVGLVGISRDLRTPGDADRIPPAFVGALEHLESNYGESITPANLARRAGLPLTRFERLVKRIFRLTPSQLIAQVRLTAASRWLEETDRPVSEIAHACGFYDHSAFTRAFRSATGLTPTRFRQQRRR